MDSFTQNGGAPEDFSYNFRLTKLSASRQESNSCRPDSVIKRQDKPSKKLSSSQLHPNLFLPTAVTDSDQEPKFISSIILLILYVLVFVFVHV